MAAKLLASCGVRAGRPMNHQHAHVLPRYADDPRPGWPFPWPDTNPAPFPEAEVQHDASALRALL